MYEVLVFFVKMIFSIIVGGVYALSFWLIKDWRMGFIWLWGISVVLLMPEIEMKEDHNNVEEILTYIIIFILALIADHIFF